MGNVRKSGPPSIIIPPEAELLLGCASVYATGSMTGRVAELAERNLDWGLVVRMASRHAVTPLVYRVLSGCPAHIPSDPLADLCHRFRANAMRNLRLASELIRITGFLNDKGVTAVAFKGPMLAYTAYGDLSLREFVDLDILVRPSDLSPTREILASHGYRSRLSALRAKERSFFQCCEDIFGKADALACIDVHWRMNPPCFAHAPEGQALWSRMVKIELQGATEYTLAVPDLLLHLCVHGAKHGWAKLGWICDVAALICRNPELDWPRLVAEATSHGGRRLLLLGLYLAYDLLGAALPGDLISMARNDRVSVRLADEVKRRMFSNTGVRAGVFQEWMVPARAIESTRERIRYLAGRALSPTIDDWELLQLPRPLFPLYYLLRPVRLTFAQGPRLIRALAGFPASAPRTQEGGP